METRAITCVPAVTRVTMQVRVLVVPRGSMDHNASSTVPIVRRRLHHQSTHVTLAQVFVCTAAIMVTMVIGVSCPVSIAFLVTCREPVSTVQLANTVLSVCPAVRTAGHRPLRPQTVI